MRLTPEDQAVVVLDAIRDCINPESGMAHLPDVVAVCVVSWDDTDRTPTRSSTDGTTSAGAGIGETIGFVNANNG